MIRITDAQYAEMARQVLTHIHERVSNDNPVFSFEGHRLMFSGYIYRDDAGNVEQIVPLWCQYGAATDGDINDFQFSELYKHFGFLK